MTAPEDRAGSEFRIAGRTLTGTVLRYGDSATVPLRDGRMVRERFTAGAFAPVPDVPLVMQHDESLVIAKGGEYILSDGPRALSVRAELRADSAALDLVRAGALRGYSFRFWPLVQAFENGERVVSKARLGHVGLVADAAYPQSKAEIRAKSGRTLRSRVPYSKRLACECIARAGPGSGGACVPYARFAKVAGDEMEAAIREAVEEARDVLAVFRDYSRPLGSARRGTLRAVSTDEGLDLEVDLPTGEAGDLAVSASESAGIIARPLIDYDRSEFTDGPDGRTVTKPYLRAILIGSTDSREGWPDARIDYDGEGRAAPAPALRRRRLWL